MRLGPECPCRLSLAASCDTCAWMAGKVHTPDLQSAGSHEGPMSEALGRLGLTKAQ